MTRCVDENAPNCLTSPTQNEIAKGVVIRAEDPLDVPDWDRLVTSAQNYSFFHSSEWARVLQETYGFRCGYLTMRSGSRLSGLLPIMEVDSWLTGRRGISLPFTDHCPVIAPDAETFEVLRQQALQ